MFCPECGQDHHGAPVVEVEPAAAVGADDGSEGEAVAITAMETVAEVATAAIDALAEVHVAEEQTEQTEAVTEMVESVADDDAEVAIVQALTDEPEPEPEPEPAAEVTEAELEEEPVIVEEPAAEGTGEVEELVPPARDEDRAAVHRAQRVSAFRARRQHR